MTKRRFWFLVIIIIIGALIKEDLSMGTPSPTNKETEAIPEEEKNKESSQENEETSAPLDPLEKLRVHYIDVGEADATLFQYTYGGESYNILFDTGNWNKTDVLTYLHSLSIKTIDLVIISHPHADHIGQLAEIMEEFSVEEVWMSGAISTSKTFQRALEAVLESEANYEEPRAGQVYDIGPLKLEVLHPQELSGDLNQDSISIRFSYGDISFLLTGDAYERNELAMLKRNPSVKAQILKLGHHGSKTSSHPNFIEAVDPEIAIYSAGAGNSYGHPAKEVISFVERKGIEIYGTDIHGTIIVSTDGDSFSIKTEKK